MKGIYFLSTKAAGLAIEQYIAADTVEWGGGGGVSQEGGVVQARACVFCDSMMKQGLGMSPVEWFGYKVSNSQCNICKYGILF